MSIDEPLNGIGCKWRLETLDEGLIEGYLANFVPEVSQYEFDKVEIVRPVDGAVGGYIGCLRVYRIEIKSAEIIDDNPETKKLYRRRVPVAPQPLDDRELEQYVIPEQIDDGDSSDSEELIAAVPLSDAINFDVEKSEINFKVDFSRWSSPASEDVIAVYSVCDESYELALKDIVSMKMIGAAAFGENVSRYGLIEFLLISTNNANYVFTEEALNERKGEINLKHVFESREIVKIVHGGRFFADALKNKYQIQLECARDTQVIDLYVRESIHKNKNFPKDLRSYEYCVFFYLSVHIPEGISSDRFPCLRHVPLSLTAESFVRAMVMPMKQLRWVMTLKFDERMDKSTHLFHRMYSDANDIEYDSLKRAESTICSVLKRPQGVLTKEPPYCEDCFFPNAECFEKSKSVCWTKLSAKSKSKTNDHCLTNGYIIDDYPQQQSKRDERFSNEVNDSRTISRSELSPFKSNVNNLGSESPIATSKSSSVSVATVSLSSDDDQFMQDPFMVAAPQVTEYPWPSAKNSTPTQRTKFIAAGSESHIGGFNANVNSQSFAEDWIRKYFD